MMRRVVVTGLGAVTPLGLNVPTSWSKLIQGGCGIKKLDPALYTSSSKVAGCVPHSWTSTKSHALFSIFALEAVKEALMDAKWTPTSSQQKERTGVCIGSGIGGFNDIIETFSIFQQKGSRRVSPFFIPKILANMPAGNVSIQHGFQGPNHAVSTACATGAHAIGDAMRFIQWGDADVMVAGATEAATSPLSVAGFSQARSLATEYNDSPEKASRPFDKKRGGFVIGEGAGVIILEELEHAKERGARIYAELTGYGVTSDGFSMTAPLEDGSGAARAIRRALELGKISPEKVGYINAHATSTPLGDLAEANAIAKVFGNRSELAVSSSKGAIGHLLGAAGAVEAIFTILAINKGILPPTLNLDECDMPFSFNFIPRKSISQQVDVAISNSFGFGGTNACLLFTRYGN